MITSKPDEFVAALRDSLAAPAQRPLAVTWKRVRRQVPRGPDDAPPPAGALPPALLCRARTPAGKKISIVITDNSVIPEFHAQVYAVLRQTMEPMKNKTAGGAGNSNTAAAAAYPAKKGCKKTKGGKKN